jgi:hypothetical protein
MKTINVLQIGLGPLGIKTAAFISERNHIQTVAAVDKNPDLIGQDLGKLSTDRPSGVLIQESVAQAVQSKEIDLAVLTTVSDMERITPQIEEILDFGIPIVSTCEELAFPWDTAPSLAKKIDEKARAKGVAVVGTGVNPGFLMDSLPTFLTAPCQKVESVEINRFQNAQYRRIPFQKKIGAGLTLQEFEERKQAGTLRHVGLTESMQMIANSLGWKLDHTEDIINPVFAEEDIETPHMQIPKGQITGVCQIGRAYAEDQLKISMIFQATVGEKESYDEVIIKGTPNIKSKIAGGVNGDIATCAIVVNCCKGILKAPAGLRTMTDIPLVSYFS